MGWLKQRKCEHRLQRRQCVHGDAIFMVFKGNRSFCADCGKLFKELPYYCWFTKYPHSSFRHSLGD